MSNDSNDTSEDVDLSPWNPQGLVRRVSRRDVELSRGFLRSKPERWVPSLSLQWMPLIHSLSSEIRIVEVRPVSSAPHLTVPGVMLALGEHYVVAAADGTSQSRFLQALAPDCAPKARGIVLEYLGRRLLGSLAISWAGQDAGRVRVFGGMNASAQEYGGAIKLVALVNGRQVTVWLLLSPSLVDELDGLWRRQLHSTTRTFAGPGTVAIEVAQLAVPPSSLAEYTRPGQAVDLDVAMSDTVVLRLNDKMWMGARICEVESHLGVEILPRLPSAPTFPDGFARLSVVFGTLDCDIPLLAELSQPGAIYDTGMPLGDAVELLVNGEKVGRGVLRCYKGRFALEVE